MYENIFKCVRHLLQVSEWFTQLSQSSQALLFHLSRVCRLQFVECPFQVVDIHQQLLTHFATGIETWCSFLSDLLLFLESSIPASTYENVLLLASQV